MSHPTALAVALALFPVSVSGAAVPTQEPPPTIQKIVAQGAAVEARADGQTVRLLLGEALGCWTLMATGSDPAGATFAVWEDFSTPKGRMVYVTSSGTRLDLGKSLEPTWAEPATLYHGHRLEEVLASPRDLLGAACLAGDRDPDFAEVAACFAPLAKTRVHTFVGTRECLEKVGIFYGGATPNFDPAAYAPAIRALREKGRVSEGLVGGWLPVVRFVYAEPSGDWTEMVAFAPRRVENGNPRVQPVWYRVASIAAGRLQRVGYFDSYHPSPPRTNLPAEPFYRDLAATRDAWERDLAPALQVDLPDQRLADMVRHSLVRAMITRVGVFPKYGVFDRGYGGSEHDGFPDTLTTDVAAMTSWGLSGLARDYLDNYFTHFVRDDGSILYRGPETGQYGRMLTVAAEYARSTGDFAVLQKHRGRLDALVHLLLRLRREALRLPAEHPAHGIIAGWCEADACLDPEPARYVQPYLSNNAEASRGFAELGAAYEILGRQRQQRELAAWGRELQAEAAALAADLQTAIARSRLTQTEPPCIPAIAGAREPFDVAFQRDALDPQFRSYRAYAELLHAGRLTREQVAAIVGYREAHHDIILGIPTCYGYNTHEWAGFLSYGHAYGLLQHDFVPQYLLTLYSLSAHHYTRGTWTAPETRQVDPAQFAAPYCTPAQLVVPLLTRWLLAFEDPQTNILWLAKGTPRHWLADGQRVAVRGAPTRWGRVGYQLDSHLAQGSIRVALDLPKRGLGVPVHLRLRVPGERRMRSVRSAEIPKLTFDAAAETVQIPASARGRLQFEVGF